MGNDCHSEKKDRENGGRFEDGGKETGCTGK